MWNVTMKILSTYRNIHTMFLFQQCWCSNSVSKKWQDNFSGKYITTNEGNYWWLSIEAGSPIGTEERLHWGRNILPSSFHSFLSSYELGTFTSCFHLHIKFQQNPKVVLWRNTKPNTFVIDCANGMGLTKKMKLTNTITTTNFVTIVPFSKSKHKIEA